MKFFLIFLAVSLLELPSAYSNSEIKEPVHYPDCIEPEYSPEYILEKVNQAWDISWERFYQPKTNQFYDYLTSYEKGKELAHLPTAEEVSRLYPNDGGFGTGMEDCMISAGVMLSMIVDQYDVTGNKHLRKSAKDVFSGIKLSATVHNVHGFLARGVSADADAAQLDLTMVTTDWRTGEGITWNGKYRRVWYNVRESGEAALAQLMAADFQPFGKDQKSLLLRAIIRLDYQKVSTCGIFYLQGAYWKAKRKEFLPKAQYHSLN